MLLVRAVIKEECCEDVNGILSLNDEPLVKADKAAAADDGAAAVELLLNETASPLELIILERLPIEFEVELILVLEPVGGGEVGIELFKSGMVMTAPVDCIIDLRLQFDRPAIKE